MRIALVGCGRLAQLGYLPAIRQSESVELVAVADPDHQRRADALATNGNLRAGRVMAFGSAEALLSGVELDAVILATPAERHLEDAERAVAAGVALLVEKPPAPDLDGARALAALDPVPFLGLNRRFDPGARAVRDVVRDLPVSDDLELDLVLHYRRRSWGAHQAHDDALLDLGPHLVDWARWLAGAEVEAVAAPVLTRDRAELVLHLDRGAARLSARADHIHHERAEVRAASAVVGRHDAGGPLAVVTGRLARGPHPLAVSLAGQLDALARAVDGGIEPDLATAADGVALMAVLDAARASAADRGRPVAVPSTKEP